MSCDPSESYSGHQDVAQPYWRKTSSPYTARGISSTNARNDSTVRAKGARHNADQDVDYIENIEHANAYLDPYCLGRLAIFTMQPTMTQVLLGTRYTNPNRKRTLEYQDKPTNGRLATRSTAPNAKSFRSEYDQRDVHLYPQHPQYASNRTSKNGRDERESIIEKIESEHANAPFGSPLGLPPMRWRRPSEDPKHGRWEIRI
ncbi:Uu.00g133800.m01.CDS01 [Anthostomella pinea]|uniref:Uu.00g133800.m01.CDS01 n=1 Tax=Anthostomella pinea TaxID=933095 RepID=A0AAI8YIC5_9PEZI|nr:Uu.00g133800.m01.CDS01 [Anthostomella pinea]